MGISLATTQTSRWLRVAFSILVCVAFASGDAKAKYFSPDTSELPTDPRMIEANSLLSERGSRDRAIELYRAVLEDDPDHRIARLWLARVLSWSGEYDASLAEYAEISLRQGDPSWARKEGADVLAWSGRYREAIEIYLELLGGHPDDFELRVGLARAYGWSGKTREAKRAYEGALELREDVLVRDELAKLADRKRSNSGLGQGQGVFLRDSDDFEIWKETNEAHYPLGERSKFKGQLGYTRIGADVFPTDARDHLEAFDWVFGLEHKLAEPLSVEVGVGARHWGHAEDRFVFRSRADYTASPRTALGFQLEHGDFLDASASFDAVRRGLSVTSLAASWWQGLGGTASAFGIFTTSFVSDGNEAVSLYLNSSLKPWKGHSLEVGISLMSTSYTGKSDHYYDPDLDLGGDVSLAARYPETGPVYARASAALGYGYAKQDGVSGDGLTYRTELGAHVEVLGFWLELAGYRAESQRSSVYTTHGATARIGRSF